MAHHKKEPAKPLIAYRMFFSQFQLFKYFHETSIQSINQSIVLFQEQAHIRDRQKDRRNY